MGLLHNLNAPQDWPDIDADMFLEQEKASLSNQLMEDWANKLISMVRANEVEFDDPGEWLESNFCVDRPRDPVTGAVLPPGLIRLAEYQKRVLKEAFARDGDGRLKYSTIVWSEPKKSGKTALAGAAGLYMASHVSSSNIYCLANDGKQSKDRILQAMAKSVLAQKRMGGKMAKYIVTWSPPTIKLPNGSVIEAIPCDAAGEAGSEPLMTIWSEMWGYRNDAKERLWTEMTIPPTLYGYAMRWVESYAGYEDESHILWQLYDNGVNNGVRHESFPDLPVYVNENARQFTFWSEDARQPWQTKEYYASEANTLTPNEFSRIHKNKWVSSTSSLFGDIITFDKCTDPIASIPLMRGDPTPVVVALDAAISGACCALYVVSRHPEDDWDVKTRRVIERHLQVWYPPKGGKINYSETIEPAVRQVCEHFNVYKVVYDPYQLHKLCTDLYMEGLAPFEEFSQMGRRLKADKQWYDMCSHRQFLHSGHSEMRKHVLNAAAKAEGRYLRIIDKTANHPIDLVITASMATDEILRLNV